jgi:Flp pilus assembly protein TadD
VFESVVCEACGAKFRGDRDRCPRCRRVIRVVDPIAAASSSRRMIRASGGIVGVFIVALGVLWWRSDRGPDAPATTVQPASTVASKQPPVAEPAAPLQRAEPGAAFLDPSGAATVAYQGGDYQTALSRFLEAIDRNPNDAESLSNLGQVLVKMGRTAEAVPHLQRATTLNPDRWAYRFNLARAFGQLGQWDESIASYQQAQRLFPDDYVTTFNLAMTLHKAGNEPAAVDQYRRAIELNPDDASFRIALANSYERLQKPADAVAAYSEYLRLSPAGPVAEQVRARIAQLTGRAPAPTPGPSQP